MKMPLDWFCYQHHDDKRGTKSFFGWRPTNLNAFVDNVVLEYYYVLALLAVVTYVRCNVEPKRETIEHM